MTVIAEILGVPLAERERVLEFGAAAAPSLDIGLGFREFRHVERSLAEFRDWLASHLAALRDHPGDDLMSRLVAEQEDGVGLTDAELEATAGLVLAAGFETTVNLLGNGAVLLREHPDQLARLRAEPELWPNAVDEALRLDPPVLLTGRVAARDTTVAGERVRRGEVVTTFLAGANRDPDVFADADRFDVARSNASDHVSFSSGRHYCLGAALARMEGEVGLRALVERYPDLTLAPGRRRRRTRILRGWATLPVTWVDPPGARDGSAGEGGWGHASRHPRIHRPPAARSRDGQLPPGQHDVGGLWPVLTAEAEPHLREDQVELTVAGLVASPTTWTLAELRALPTSTYAGDIHCVTSWSKLGTRFTGVSLDVLLGAAGPLDEARHVVAESVTGYTTNLPLADVHRLPRVGRVGPRGPPAAARARRSAPAAGAAPVLLEVRQVGLPPRADRRRPARLLGAQRLPRPRRPVARAALPGRRLSRWASTPTGASRRAPGPPAPSPS